MRSSKEARAVGLHGSSSQVKRQLTVQLPVDQYMALEREAARQKVPMSLLVRREIDGLIRRAMK